ncbi:MAG: MerR family transcriptional regulator [Polyangiaceae bacterium]|nr:MerR family transcriptional regulator [Polyangiaceae bacterium]
MVTAIYKIDELARKASVSVRTVRYYVQRGLLPPPEFRAKDTVYTDEHLLRLRAIRRLSEERMALDEIAVRIAHMTPARLEEVAKGNLRDLARSPGGDRDSGTVKNDRTVKNETVVENDDVGEDGVLPDSVPPGVPTVARVYRIANGVELWVHDNAPPSSMALVREIIQRHSRHSKDNPQ